VTTPKPIAAPRAAEIRVLPTRALSDAELAELAKVRDPRAASLIWHRYASLVRGILRRSLGPSSDVEDLVQEVFLGFFQSVPELRDAGALRSFLIGITLRTAGSSLRRKRVRRWLTLTDSGQVPEVAGAADDTDAREALARLYAVLDKIDDQGRLAFTLRYFEGYELTEVATALDCSLATIKRKLAKAQEKVHAMLARDPLLARYLEEAPKGGSL
jgi:RNA polymerase sigma-70 factor (ECF subfamily)